MANFNICWTITTDGQITVEAENLIEAKKQVEGMTNHDIQLYGTVDYDRLTITDGWDI